MAIKMLLVFTCFSLACVVVWAGPSKVVVRSEEARWIAEVIGPDQDGWPHVISRKSFATQVQALAQQERWQQEPSLQIQSTVSFQPQMAKGVVWPTTQSWSEEWEAKYAKWIEDEVDTEFFVRYKVATDCADVAYSLRWIFARIHGLPAAANLGGSGPLLTNETLRANWAALPTSANWYEDRRFLATLNYLLDMTYTHTLWSDSFPVALTKEAILSGSYHLNVRPESGHTQLIHWMSSASGIPFLTLNSTVPRKVRSLSDSMLFAGEAVDKKSGILRFRWAVKNSNGISLKKATEMPGYSMEQFSFKPGGDYAIALFEKLGYTGGREGIRNYLYQDILAQFKTRINLVKEAQRQCQNGACRPGTEAWEEWSTPSRDSRIKGKISSLRAVSDAQAGEPAILSEVILTLEDIPWTYRSLIWNWQNDEFDSDPQVSEAQRWGAGGSSWVQRQLQIFQAKVQERQDVLKKGAAACAGKNCDFGTDLWKKTSATEIDVFLAKKNKYLTQDPKQLPAELLPLLDVARATSLDTVKGQNITFDHMLTSLSAMNASALASTDQQWAFGDWVTMQTSTQTRPTIVADKWVVEERPTRSVVWDLTTGKTLALSFQPLRFFEKAGVLLVKTEQEYALYDLRTEKLEPLPGSLQNNSPASFFVYEDKLIARDPHRLQVWNVDFKDLHLAFAAEVAGAQWKYLGYGVFKTPEKIYDAKYQTQSADFPTDRVMCGTANYLAFMDRDVRLFSRKAGINVLHKVDGFSGVDCENRFISNYAKAADLTSVWQWDEKLQLHVVFEVKGACDMGNEGKVLCKDATYQYQGGQWKKLNKEENRYVVRYVQNAPWELIDMQKGQVIMKARVMNVVEDRFVMVSLDAGDYVHVVDLKDRRVPVLTNIFKADWMNGQNTGSLQFLTGYSQDEGGRSLLWRPPQ